jgi:S1-C subfamily serine protease
MTDALERGTALQQLSDNLADAVEGAGAWTVTVNARRRFPATGIVWAEGLIVTANHVVEVDDEITVGLADGRTIEATLTGRDPSSDLALLRVQITDLPIPPRAAAEPRVGNLALAIGRPTPSGPVASFGVISTVHPFFGRQRSDIADNLIHAEVAMLPGFSGGPLIDASGNLIGLNSSHFARGGGGLTITNEAIDKVVAALQTHGKIRRGFLGIGAQAVPIPEALASAAGATQETGLVIVSVEQGGPAEQGGVLLGDVILSVNNRAVGSVEELQEVLSGDLVGQQATLNLIRGGNAHSLAVTVGERGA